MSDDQLKPCPFCGGEAEYEGLYCYCLQCESRMADNPDEASAIAAWNRRASPTSEAIRREALEEAARVVEAEGKEWGNREAYVAGEVACENAAEAIRALSLPLQMTQNG